MLFSVATYIGNIPITRTLKWRRLDENLVQFLGGCNNVIEDLDLTVNSFLKDILKEAMQYELNNLVQHVVEHSLPNVDLGAKMDGWNNFCCPVT